MDNASPPVSPTVVASILMTQNTRVTCGTLLIQSRDSRLAARLATIRLPFAMPCHAKMRGEVPCPCMRKRGFLLVARTVRKVPRQSLARTLRRRRQVPASRIGDTPGYKSGGRTSGLPDKVQRRAFSQQLCKHLVGRGSDLGDGRTQFRFATAKNSAPDADFVRVVSVDRGGPGIRQIRAIGFHGIPGDRGSHTLYGTEHNAPFPEPAQGIPQQIGSALVAVAPPTHHR